MVVVCVGRETVANGWLHIHHITQSHLTVSFPFSSGHKVHIHLSTRSNAMFFSKWCPSKDGLRKQCHDFSCSIVAGGNHPLKNQYLFSSAVNHPCWQHILSIFPWKPVSHTISDIRGSKTAFYTIKYGCVILYCLLSNFDDDEMNGCHWGLVEHWTKTDPHVS